MKTPNIMMKNLLGNHILAQNPAVQARIILLSGSDVLTAGEREILSRDTFSAYMVTWSTIVAEMTKTRQQAAMYVSGPIPRAQGIGKFALALSEATYTMSMNKAGVNVGLMLMFLGTSSSSYNMAMTLSVGLKGSGADIEVSDTISTLDMMPMHHDLILNFE